MSQWKDIAVVPDLTCEYDREVLKGISRFLHEERRWIIHLHDDPRTRIARLRRWRGHGVIANTDDVKVLQTVRRLGVPIVGYGGVEVHDNQVYFLRGDNESFARMAAEHLIERGLIRFAYCAWPATRINPWSAARGNFFAQTVREAGFSCEFFPARGGESEWPVLLKQLSEWLASLEKPVGLMAANDARARQVLEVCREIRAAVPDEIAVIGVDNHELICNMSTPPLTSIIHGGERLGYEAGVLLRKILAGRIRSNRDLPVIPPLGVVTRHSTDTLAVNDPVVATAVRYIRDHAIRPVQVRDVVAQTDVSRATLEMRFKQVVGRTIHAEIRRVQIQRVQHLLRTTQLPLHKIAELTGFRYEQYLAAVFRQACGQTPGQYRDYVRSQIA